MLDPPMPAYRSTPATKSVRPSLKANRKDRSKLSSLKV
jgi:hypothetical protein